MGRRNKPHRGPCECGDCMFWDDYYDEVSPQKQMRRDVEHERQQRAEERYTRGMCINRVETAHLEGLTTDQLSALATIVNRMEAPGKWVPDIT